jgi:hypothetical protein
MRFAPTDMLIMQMLTYKLRTTNYLIKQILTYKLEITL